VSSQKAKTFLVTVKGLVKSWTSSKVVTRETGRKNMSTRLTQMTSRKMSFTRRGVKRKSIRRRIYMTLKRGLLTRLATKG
jgi:hypothetical protein